MKYKKEIVLEAIQDSKGIMSNIAKALDCEWHTAQSHVLNWVETRKAMEDEKETTIDFVESKLFGAIDGGSESMIRYYLSTQGKRRGYTEKQEIEHLGNKENPLIQEHHIKLSEALKGATEEQKEFFIELLRSKRSS